MATTKTQKAAAAQKKALAAVAQNTDLLLLRALHPIRHDGRDYDEGEELAVDTDAAAQLLDSGAAETADVPV